MSTDTKTVDVLAIGVIAAIDNCAHYLREEAGLTAAAEQMEAVSVAIDELMVAARPLVARSFDEARDNEDQRIAARKSGAYPPPEMLWCRADALNPCWMPGTPYTGKHWGWTPDAEGDGEVCEHCRLRAALARAGGAA